MTNTLQNDINPDRGTQRKKKGLAGNRTQATCISPNSNELPKASIVPLDYKATPLMVGTSSREDC